MARPIKKGLSYFPLDSDFLSDRKMQRLLQNHGHTSICTYLTLLCEIYSTNGYYHPYSGDLCLDIASSLQVIQEGQVEKDSIFQSHSTYQQSEKSKKKLRIDFYKGWLIIGILWILWWKKVK